MGRTSECLKARTCVRGRISSMSQRSPVARRGRVTISAVGKRRELVAAASEVRRSTAHSELCNRAEFRTIRILRACLEWDGRGEGVDGG